MFSNRDLSQNHGSTIQIGDAGDPTSQVERGSYQRPANAKTKSLADRRQRLVKAGLRSGGLADTRHCQARSMVYYWIAKWSRNHSRVLNEWRFPLRADLQCAFLSLRS